MLQKKNCLCYNLHPHSTVSEYFEKKNRFFFQILSFLNYVLHSMIFNICNKKKPYNILETKDITYKNALKYECYSIVQSNNYILYRGRG